MSVTHLIIEDLIKIKTLEDKFNWKGTRELCVDGNILFFQNRERSNDDFCFNLK